MSRHILKIEIEVDDKARENYGMPPPDEWFYDDLAAAIAADVVIKEKSHICDYIYIINP